MNPLHSNKINEIYILINNACLGFEISDVLRISDKDYSITFGLYFSVEWLEPRMNLSKELWGEGNIASETELIPGNKVPMITMKCSFLLFAILTTRSILIKRFK